MADVAWCYLYCIFAHKIDSGTKTFGGHKKLWKVHNLAACDYVENKRIGRWTQQCWCKKQYYRQNFVIALLGNMPFSNHFQRYSYTTVVAALENPL